MNFWTILVVTFIGGPMNGESMGLLYPSESACNTAHRAVSAGLGYDHSIKCEATMAMSSSIRPKRRPEGLK